MFKALKIVLFVLAEAFALLPAILQKSWQAALLFGFSSQAALMLFHCSHKAAAMEMERRYWDIYEE